jgi:EAL domain-containing protein (putative c-di-GMP-specific phosphodiesterase class I)
MLNTRIARYEAIVAVIIISILGNFALTHIESQVGDYIATNVLIPILEKKNIYIRLSDIQLLLRIEEFRQLGGSI